MKLDQSKGIGGLLKQGHTTQEGVDEAVSKNIEAAKQLGRIVHSSMGPNGMNKLVINHLEKTIVTSDCATIVRELEVAHPAARMITLAAEMQEQEAGDGTNLVIAFSSELLKHSEDLLRSGLHPSEIIEARDVAQLTDAVKPVVCAKQPGYENVLAPVI